MGVIVSIPIPNPPALTLTPKEASLIEKLRRIPYGQVVIYMEAGQLLRIERITESVKL